MYNFLLELARIWRGNALNTAGLLLVTAGVSTLVGISQFLIPPLGELFGLQVSIPENSTAVSWLLIVVGVAVLLFARLVGNVPFQSGALKFPGARATINGTAYRDGWRSVQIHITPPPGDEVNYLYGNWRIDRVRLLRPFWGAVLARAHNDDYSSGQFFPDNPIRVLEGKPLGSNQLYALEFFIKFDGDDRGRQAKFKVKFSNIRDTSLRRTMRLWARVPDNAQ